MRPPTWLVPDRWLAGGGVLVGVLLVAMALNVATTRRQQENARAVSHSHDVIDAIDDARNRVRELELLERAYLLSGRTEDLERVGPAAAIAQSSARRVEGLTQGDARQQARIPELLQTLQQLEEFYRSAAEVRRVNGAAAARGVILGGNGVQLVEHLGAMLGLMESDERQALYTRAASSEEAYRAALATGLTSGIASVLLLLGFMALLRRHLERGRKDAEELRALGRELQQAARRKDRFLATLAHELRNPLAPVRTATGILGSPHLDPVRLEWCRNVITRQVGQMAALLDDLLDVTRISQGKLKLRHETVGLGTIVDVALEAARPIIDRKHHVLNVQLPALLPTVDVDPVRLGQALTNLLTNAAKYTDPDGTITFTAEVRGRDLVLGVQDNGIGIDPQALGDSFTMFTQLDGDGTRAEGGLGIGLALTRGVVQLHGGTIVARSEGRGRGSTFTIELPGVVVEAGTPARNQPADDTRPNGHRVLVVDDNRDAGTAMGMILEMAGHSVHVVTTIDEALESVHAFSPGIAFVDIDMPGMDAYALARALRSTREGRDMALVAVSGWGQADDKALAEAAGFDAHLAKPIDPDVIAALLARPVHELTQARLAS
ncbi:MAG: ATP-binding protein [Ramlibacter sp.]